MSTIRVAEVTTEDGATNLTLKTGNTTGPSIVIGTGQTVYIGNSTSNSFISNSSGVFDSGGNLRDVPQVTQSTAYTLTLSDAGKHISTTANAAVPASVFSVGDAVSIYNNSAASITIVQNSGVTMYLAGTATTGNRTLAQRGLATVLCVAANSFVISGGGLT
jgi:hypothetical protein